MGSGASSGIHSHVELADESEPTTALVQRPLARMTLDAFYKRDTAAKVLHVNAYEYCNNFSGLAPGLALNDSSNYDTTGPPANLKADHNGLVFFGPAESPAQTSSISSSAEKKSHDKVNAQLRYHCRTISRTIDQFYKQSISARRSRLPLLPQISEDTEQSSSGNDEKRWTMPSLQNMNTAPQGELFEQFSLTAPETMVAANNIQFPKVQVIIIDDSKSYSLRLRRVIKRIVSTDVLLARSFKIRVFDVVGGCWVTLDW